MKRWYVAETKHHQELFAALNLEAQGFPTLAPMIQRVPVLRGYVFVKFDRRWDPWPRIGNTRGVKQLLWPDNPEPLPQDEIDHLWELGAGVQARDLEPVLVGMAVKICAGPLSGLIGRVVEAGKRLRVQTDKWTISLDRGCLDIV